MSKVHLIRYADGGYRQAKLRKGERKALCGKENPPMTAIGPDAVTCATCRANSGFAFYEAGWKARDRQGD